MSHTATMKPIGVYIYTMHPEVSIEDNVLDIVSHIIEHTEDQREYWETRLEYITEEGNWINHKFRSIQKSETIHDYVYSLCKRWMDILTGTTYLDVRIELRFHGENFMHELATLKEFEELRAEVEDCATDENGNVLLNLLDTNLPEKYKERLKKIIDNCKEVNKCR
jgi:hypothetical protein